MTIGGVEDVIDLYRDVSEYNSAFNHDASDSMKFLGQGELPPPASCFVCGSGNCEAGYLYFGMWMDGIGNLSVCASCLVIGAEKLGCLAPSVKLLFEKNIGQLQDHAKALEAKVESLEHSNSALLTIVHDFNSADRSNDLVNSVADQIPETVDPAPDTTGDPTRPDHTDPDEPVISERPLHVPEPTKSDRYGGDEPLLRL